MALMTQISLSGELATLSAERVWQEMQRALSEGNDEEGDEGGVEYHANEQHPEIFFEVLHQCQALKALWPELDILWGVPNPAEWHPEICSGVHTMMVLQQAVLLTANNKNKTAIRFAALCHDLGKGLTADDLLPSHRGHEKSGLPLVEKISKQLRVPNYCKQLALKVCEHHLHCHKAFQLKASTLLRIFNQLDVWRKPQEFEDFLIACKSDFLGRLGFENKPYPQEQYLKDTAQAATMVNAKEFVEQGLQGIAIKEAIEKARLQAIKKIKQQYQIV
jgi:tRNA nucleotidyltransferase (CCA-adding enzyme)